MSKYCVTISWYSMGFRMYDDFMADTQKEVRQIIEKSNSRKHLDKWKREPDITIRQGKFNKKRFKKIGFDVWTDYHVDKYVSLYELRMDYIREQGWI